MFGPTLQHRLRTFAAGLADLVWPRSCFLCDQPVADVEPSACLCGPCRAELTADNSTTCPRCASTVGPFTDLSDGCLQCRGKRFHFAGAVRLGPYAGRLREAVLRLKHEAGEPLAEELGELFADVRRSSLTASQPEVVVPIPLHWRRRWTRGYNQSAAVARALACRLGLPCRPGWLVRVRPTPSQRAQSATERWANVRGAFRVDRSAAVRGARILLVDDVLTTGATADAAAVALGQAGAAQVTTAVLAHG